MGKLTGYGFNLIPKSYVKRLQGERDDNESANTGNSFEALITALTGQVDELQQLVDTPQGAIPVGYLHLEKSRAINLALARNSCRDGKQTFLTPRSLVESGKGCVHFLCNFLLRNTTPRYAHFGIMVGRPYGELHTSWHRPQPTPRKHGIKYITTHFEFSITGDCKT